MTSAGGHGSPADPFAPERIIETLVRHGVEFVLVGGVGAQRHGAQRPTHDIDVVANFDRANLDRLAAAMRELGARIRAEGFDDTQARAVADTMVHPDFFRRQELSTWRTDVGDLDVLHDMPARDGARQTYAELVERSTTAVYGPVTLTSSNG